MNDEARGSLSCILALISSFANTGGTRFLFTLTVTRASPVRPPPSVATTLTWL